MTQNHLPANFKQQSNKTWIMKDSMQYNNKAYQRDLRSRFFAVFLLYSY